MGATYICPPSRVVYASSAGIVLDGATNQTTQVQAILDRFGSAGTPLRFVVDGPLLLDSIYLYSQQHLDGVGNALITKKPYPGNSGRPLIMNKHPVLGTTTIGGTDANITITNLQFDGNRRNGGSGAAFPNGGAPWASAAGYIVPVIEFAGASNVHIENVHIFDPPAYGIHFANVTNAVMVNCSSFLNPGDNYEGSNLFQCQGYCTGIRAYGIYGSCNDDFWAFNANDVNDLAPGSYATFYPGTVVQGPIQHCSVDGCHVTGYPTGGRFLSSNPAAFINDVTISNYTCHNPHYELSIDNYGISLGSGSFDNITLENVRFETNAHAAIRIGLSGATVNNLTIRGCYVNFITADSSDAASALVTTANATVQSLRVTDLTLDNPGGAIPQPVIALAGTVNHFSLTNGRLNRGTHQLAYPVISATGTIGRLQVFGGQFDHVNNVVNVSAGTTAVVQGIGVSHTNANSNATYARSGGTFTTLLSTMTDTSLLSSGTIANNTGNS